MVADWKWNQNPEICTHMLSLVITTTQDKLIVNGSSVRTGLSTRIILPDFFEVEEEADCGYDYVEPLMVLIQQQWGLVDSVDQG